MRQLPAEAVWRRHDAIQCLECGQWRSALGKHLTAAHGMTADEYRAAWGMRQRQPLTAGYLSEVRREIAVATGGPERLRELAPQVAHLAAAARVGREQREQERRVLRRMQGAAAARSAAQAESRANASARKLGFEDTRAYLRQRYGVDQQPIRVLVAELRVNKQVVRRLMDYHQIPVRGPGPAPTKASTADDEGGWSHGASGYRSYGCRCDVCTAANTERARGERAARKARFADNPNLAPHGSVHTYGNWGCRCAACKAANSRKSREWKRRNARDQSQTRGRPAHQ